MSRSATAMALLALLLCAAPVQAQDLPTLERARALYDAGGLGGAERMLEGLVREGTQDPGVFQLLGVVQRTAGQLDRAIASLERARALAPESMPIAVELGVTLSWRRDLDRAIGLFREVLAAEPGNAGARNGLAFALAWQGRLDEAREMFTAMTEDDPANVGAWMGVGFVERVSFRGDAAQAAYQRVLELEPGNTEAADALDAVHWERRSEVRVLSGFSVEPGATARGEARVDLRYAIDQRLGLIAGYQRYGYGAATPITGGGTLSGTRTEDSVEGGLVFRPSDQTTVSAIVSAFFSGEANRAIIWFTGAHAIAPRVTLIGAVRPAFSSADPGFLMAGTVGGSVAIAPQHQVTVRALIAGDTEFEPRLTTFADYDAQISRRLRVHLGGAYSGSDEQYAFTSAALGAAWMLSPAIGISADVTRRFESYERSTLLVGLVLRR